MRCWLLLGPLLLCGGRRGPHVSLPATAALTFPPTMTTASLPVGQAPAALKHNPPFRHEHVGSFLRTPAVHTARADFAQGKLDSAGLRAVENAEIKKHIDRCLKWNVRDLTDAEFRRQYFHVDFLQHIDGVEVQKNCECVFAPVSPDLPHRSSLCPALEQKEGHVPPTLAVRSKLRHLRNIEVDNFEFLKSIIREECLSALLLLLLCSLLLALWQLPTSTMRSRSPSRRPPCCTSVAVATPSPRRLTPALTTSSPTWLHATVRKSMRCTRLAAVISNWTTPSECAACTCVHVLSLTPSCLAVWLT